MSSFSYHIIPNQSDSGSLWNYTKLPRWTLEEIEVLKTALIKYGVGCWSKIQRVNCLPGKTIAQMNLQTQKLLGQQSLAEFMGLHVDLKRIFEDNKKKNALRKNKCVINNDDKLTKEEKQKLIEDNKKKYEYVGYQKLKIPKTFANSIGRYMTIEQIKDNKNNLTTLEKIGELKNLVKCMKKKLEIIETNLQRKRERDNKYDNNYNTNDNEYNERFVINVKKVAVQKNDCIDYEYQYV